jgi:chromosomal replication initiation ATPase DnaA
MPNRSTGQPFFETFNALHENHKQIGLPADRKPHEISDIADRLGHRRPPAHPCPSTRRE